MVDVAGAVRSVLDRLTAAGIRACLDERDVNPPAVYVAPPALAWRYARGDYDATFTAWCVVPGSGRDIALRNLGALIDQVIPALVTPDSAVVTGDPADLLVPDQAAPLPGYRLSWTERVRQPRTNGE